MSLTVTVIDHWEDTKRLHITGVLTPSGNYVTGGDVIPFGIPQIKSNSMPSMLLVTVFCPDGTVTYTFTAVAGTTIANCKLKVIVTATPGVELAQAAYPAPLIAHPPAFYAI